MTEEHSYTIGELAQAAGVTPRTIRYYTAEGLLPPPDTRGRYALYGETHLLRLRLIARLKDAYLPLGEIKSRLQPLSNEQMQQLLTTETQPTPSTGSASDYIAQVLGKRSMPPTSAEATYKQSHEATTRDRPMVQAHAPFGKPSPSERYKEAPSQPSLHLGYVEPLPEETTLPRPTSLLSRLAPPDQTSSEPKTEEVPETSERWQRIVLAPGVELHILEPLTPKQREQIEQLVTQARTWLEDND
ncbi:MAG: hypothetical protein GFH27_549333n27 [Chloroflexi bacterium AL-W]|nr:hypothetical protein [Chloroflexi bacterium AL-N1]NOK70520.1 hypothetical protein [Chloroflexi bacterium AL-N10]NOK78121.1 hypothetical protein [Chloroflexi bacterium AL-N5]NOK85220.1 hypothetical protein [Chloroflexi bacterium AL-W]NOK91985.1 hypothetical protein [Chloroflexi bacterium AL-N15]